MIDHNLIFRSVCVSTIIIVAAIVVFMPTTPLTHGGQSPVNSSATALWQVFGGFLNSGFITSVAGALAGAFFGASAAQKIALRNKSKDDLLSEIRNTNAAIMVSFSICNTIISLKKQHIKNIKELFSTSRAEVAAFSKRGEPIECTLDLQKIPVTQLPLAILQMQLFEKLSLTGRPLHVEIMLNQTVDALNTAINKRNQLIESYKTMPIEEVMKLYFGLPYGGGHVNLEYPSLIEAIALQTDCAIFFSKLLCEDLSEHGDRSAEKFKMAFGDGAPKIAKPEFSKAAAMGLLPDPAEFSDLFEAFASKKPG